MWQWISVHNYHTVYMQCRNCGKPSYFFIKNFVKVASSLIIKEVTKNLISRDIFSVTVNFSNFHTTRLQKYSWKRRNPSFSKFIKLYIVIAIKFKYELIQSWRNVPQRHSEAQESPQQDMEVRIEVDSMLLSSLQGRNRH